MTEIYTPKSLTHLHVHIFFIINNKLHSTGIQEGMKRMKIVVKRHNFCFCVKRILNCFLHITLELKKKIHSTVVYLTYNYICTS